MFKAELSQKFKDIFGVNKVTFDSVSESKEQECMFIEVENSRNTIKDGRAKSYVTGRVRYFGKSDKIPFGFFSKAIREADAALTKDLFFEEFESNAVIYRDIIELGFSFVYFFDSQYDPSLGSIESININVGET